MMRDLLCGGCGERFRYPNDARARIVRGRAKTPTPAQRTVTIQTWDTNGPLDRPPDNEEAKEMDPGFYNCDFCNAAIRPGDEAFCVSVWREVGQEPERWEREFIR